jgi:predicted metal-binding membrane protein
MRPVAHGRNWLVPIMLGLIGTAWAALLLLDHTPYGRYLDHGRWTEIGFTATICRALPAGQLLLPALLYVAGWMLMTSAMMLPTTLPLLRRFEVITMARSDQIRLVALLASGYLAVWLVFGVAIHALDVALHVVARHSDWLVTNAWSLGVGVLAIAGVFQFSGLKYRCLDKCRTPLSFIIQHWRGVTPQRDAFRLGLHHGLFCVGCCWAIMLLMFAVGMGNIGWMLMLGVVMAIEKNAPWGRKLGHPLGLVLIGSAAFVTAAHLA